MENDKYTIAGMFLGHLSESQTQGPSVFARLYPELVNWVTNYADWTQDSKCSTFTSCSCGIPARKYTEKEGVHRFVER